MKEENILHVNAPLLGFKKFPKSARIILFIKRTINSYIKHFVHYYLFPMSVFERPFRGRSSSFLRKGTTTDRDGEKFLVFSEREVKIREKDGTSKDNFEIIGDPLKWEESSLLIEKFYTKSKIFDSGSILIVLDEPVGLLNKDFENIRFEDYLEIIHKLVLLLREKYADKKILVKPHPNTYKDSELMFHISKLADFHKKVEIVVNSSNNPHFIISQCDVIIGEVSTFLLLAASYDYKIVISINLFNRFLGDVFKEFPNIMFFQNLEEFKVKFINSKDLVEKEKDF